MCGVLCGSFCRLQGGAVFLRLAREHTPRRVDRSCPHAHRACQRTARGEHDADTQWSPRRARCSPSPPSPSSEQVSGEPAQCVIHRDPRPQHAHRMCPLCVHVAEQVRNAGRHRSGVNGAEESTRAVCAAPCWLRVGPPDDRQRRAGFATSAEPESGDFKRPKQRTKQ